jgi:Domain of unknown function (DUF4965)/Domain of unknown function (DUF1793)/Domain of unknown function (DUF5127)/Domain of unknown function (DUF4964)
MKLSVCLGYLAGAAVLSMAQSPAQNRPPATPLITHNPYFSVWSNTDNLSDSLTRHWTGHPQPLTGLVRIDAKCFRIMGGDPKSVPALQQTSLVVTPMHTRYTFQGNVVEVELSFYAPAFLSDLDLLSRPVTYLAWAAHSTDGADHVVEVLLVAGAEMATSYPGQPVVFSRHRTVTTQVLCVGTRDQAVLNRSGDDLRIDWGYFDIAIPDAESSETTISNRPSESFMSSGRLNSADTMEGPTPANRFAPQLAVSMSFGNVGPTPVTRHLLLAYTQEYAIQLMHQNLRPYWQRNNKTASAMLDEAERDYVGLERRGRAFDSELTADLTRVGGEHYAWLSTLSYRQAIAAHMLVADVDENPMLFAKENFSNGDIATVNVLYPSAPLFLLFNPKLLEAQILPVLEYAAMHDRWRFDFAPHDLGQYPLANGQEYGGGELSEEDQMPIEESGNLLILVDALDRFGGDHTLATRFWPQLTRWANYLQANELDPQNQLTTDDFAGHVAHNANLSIKAIEGVAAYADLAKRLQRPDAETNASAARSMARQWVTMAQEGDHYKLAFNSPGTWSQKYNLVWDKLLHLKLFPTEVHRAETAFYLTKLNIYGLPLDSRADYTKLDWELWTATLADKPREFQQIIDPIYRWTNETTSRVPLTDWYDTKTGKQVSFQARSVVGGVFIKALSDEVLASKWRQRSIGK